MKIKWGMFITDGFGKSGGNVMSRNKSGNYVKTRVTPINPQTIISQPRRGYYSYLTQTWKTLSAANIVLWNAATVNYPRLDRIGNTYYPSGFNLYLELNLNVYDVGGAYLAAPPVKAIPPALPVITPVITLGPPFTLTLNYASLLPVSTDIFQVFASPALSPGRSTVTSQYRVVTTITNTGQAANNIGAAYLTRFPIPYIGSRIFIKAVNTSTAGSQGVVNISSGLTP